MTYWGIAGTGRMAEAMYNTITALPGSSVVAVASSSRSRAEAFAGKRGIPGVYSSVGEMAGRAPIDSVYVATTNDRHHEDVLACLRQGKGVLCEKPLALTLAQAEEMVAEASRLKVFLMEAMWMRFQPAAETLLGRVEAGVIGTPRLLSAGFAIKGNDDPGGRWFSPSLGGGSLYDLGVYPVALSYLLFGPPSQVEVVVIPAGTGVDAQTGLAMVHPDGALAMVWSSLVADGGAEAVVAGETGRIVVHTPFHHATRLSLFRERELIETWEVADLGYRPEVEEVERCLRLGLTESPCWSHRDSLAVMTTISAALERR
ncbi:MAG TPA: Gfo/Idh/MocA family oxidoreductase [Acidimicrobiia bacterium]|nr:Gfo/Idh/MocA family oxidoreductase [Acidimicrobiia bacterium]